MRRTLPILLLTLALTGCDQLSERLGMPAPAKVLAEGKAVGGACRHAGRGLEDCYRLNPHADKAAVYEGWKEMNEYMTKNNMQSVPPSVAEESARKAKKSSGEDEEENTDEHDQDKADAKSELHEEKPEAMEKAAKHAKAESEVHGGGEH